VNRELFEAENRKLKTDNSTKFVVGVDGCRGGWLAVRLDRNGAGVCRVFPDMGALWAAYRRAALILVDIPIGLPEAANDRSCDKAARKVLGPRRASVFPVPCRGAVYAPSYDAAINLNERITGKRIFRAAWNLVPRMRQVDEILRADSRVRGVIREAHPEVLFWGLNQRRPLAFYKKEAAGEAERLEVLQRVYGGAKELFFALKRELTGRNAAPDDLLDALAAAVTGFIGRNKLRTLPDRPERDAHGLPMEMVYFVP
jgi:predicted RNase H-like nuclease